jgi:hypothetical protein
MTTKHVNLRLSPELHSWLVDAAAREHRSVNAFIEWRLEGERARKVGEESRGEFSYIDHPQARSWAHQHRREVASFTNAVAGVVGSHLRGDAIVTAWVAAGEYPGDAGEQQREIRFQLMTRRSTPPTREMSEELDRVLAEHLPLPQSYTRVKVRESRR